MQVSYQLDLVDSNIHTNGDSCKINTTNSLPRVTVAPNKPTENIVEIERKKKPHKFQSKDKNYFSQITLYLPQKNPFIIEFN